MPGQYGASRRGYTLWPDRIKIKYKLLLPSGRIRGRRSTVNQIKSDLAPEYRSTKSKEVSKNHATRRSIITEKLAQELIIHVYNDLFVGCICPFKCGIQILLL